MQCIQKPLFRSHIKAQAKDIHKRRTFLFVLRCNFFCFCFLRRWGGEVNEQVSYIQRAREGGKIHCTVLFGVRLSAIIESVNCTVSLEMENVTIFHLISFKHFINKYFRNTILIWMNLS